MLVLFIALIVGPIVASKVVKNLPSIPDQLVQPTGLNNNDTTSSQTGYRPNAAAAVTGSAVVRRLFAEFSY